MTPKSRKAVIGMVLATLIGVGAWLAWDRMTTPPLPKLALEGSSPEKIQKIGQVLDNLRRQPRSGDSWGELSMTLMANGFLEQAIPCFAQAERLDPQQPRWPYFQGALLLTFGRREGFAKVRQALGLTHASEERSAVLFQLAQALIEDGQLDEAAERLGELRELDGETAGVHLGLALLANNRGDRATARLHLSKLTVEPSARKKACTLLASLEDDPALAQDYHRQALELPDDQPWPGSFEMDLQRFRAQEERQLASYYELASQKKTAEAIAELRKLVRESPSEAICFGLGYNLVLVGEFEEAAGALRQALGFNAKNVKAHLFLGVCLFELGEKRRREADSQEQAAEMFRQAVRAEESALSLQKDLPHAQLTRARALNRLGRVEESLQAFREAVLLDSNSVEMHLALGEALAEAGHICEGLESLNNAAELARPDDQRPHKALEKWRKQADKKP